jgi:hypothetical protein
MQRKPCNANRATSNAPPCNSPCNMQHNAKQACNTRCTECNGWHREGTAELMKLAHCDHTLAAASGVCIPLSVGRACASPPLRASGADARACAAASGWSWSAEVKYSRRLSCQALAVSGKRRAMRTRLVPGHGRICVYRRARACERGRWRRSVREGGSNGGRRGSEVGREAGTGEEA